MNAFMYIVCVCIAGEEQFAQYTFALIMFIFCLFIKLGGIYVGAHFFSAIGGAYAMEYNLDQAYESVQSKEVLPSPPSGAYNPPDYSHDNTQHIEDNSL